MRRNRYKSERTFRAKSKIIIENGIYHIIQRAPGKEKLFLEDGDYLYFLYLLKEIAGEYSLDIFSFVLMSNHLHILLRINMKNLPRAMKDLYQRYALYFNLKYQRKGHVFSGVYRAALCNSDIYLLAISVYIHLNPVKAGMAEEAEDYRWSSIKLYLSEQKSKFVDAGFVLDLLSKDRNTGQKCYKELLSGRDDFKYENCFKNKRWLSAFMKGFYKKLKQVSILGSKDIMNFIALEEQLDRIKSIGKVRSPQKVEAKRYLIQQLVSLNYSLSEIAGKLGVTRQSIYYILNQAE